MDSPQYTNSTLKRQRSGTHDIVLSEELLSSFCDRSLSCRDKGGYPPTLHQVAPDLVPEVSRRSPTPLADALPIRRLGEQTKILPRRHHTPYCPSLSKHHPRQLEITDNTSLRNKQNTTHDLSPQHRRITSVDLSARPLPRRSASFLHKERQLTSILEGHKQGTTTVGLTRRTLGHTPLYVQQEHAR